MKKVLDRINGPLYDFSPEGTPDTPSELPHDLPPLEVTPLGTLHNRNVPLELGTTTSELAGGGEEVFQKASDSCPSCEGTCKGPSCARSCQDTCPEQTCESACICKPS